MVADQRTDFYVYLLCRPDERPCYVGKGRGDRWRRHEMKGRHTNLHLERIILAAKQDGASLPKLKLACDLTEQEAFDLERDMIRLVGRETDGGPLVNLTDGGDGPAGYRPSKELIARQVAARSGWVRTPEYRAKVSAALKGRKQSAEHIANVSAAMRGSKKSHGWWSTEEGRAKQRENNPGERRRGQKRSQETIEKIRAARMRQTNVSTAGQFKAGRKLQNATANQGDDK